MYTPTFRTKKNGVPVLSEDELDINLQNGKQGHSAYTPEPLDVQKAHGMAGRLSLIYHPDAEKYGVEAGRCTVRTD